MVILKRISKFKYQFSGSPEQETTIRNALSVRTEGYQFTQAFKDWGWDGKHKFYNKQNIFLFGLLNIVTKKLTEKNIPFKIIDEIKLVKVLTDNLDLRLYVHQKEGINQFFLKNFGIILIPTRGGKTFTAAEGIRLVLEQHQNQKVIFVVDGIDLLNQTIKEISNFLNIPKKNIGTIQGEVFEPKQITLATVQTIQSIIAAKIRKTKKPLSQEKILLKTKENRLRKKALLDYFKTVKFGIFDEIHDCMASDSRISILKYFDFDFLLGLSATPYKSGETEEDMNSVANLNLMANFGGIVYTVEEEVLRGRGVLAKDKVLLLLIPHKFEDYEVRHLEENEPEQSAKRYQYYENRVIFDNKDRDSIILQIISIVRKLKVKTLMLFESVRHGKNIEKLSGEKFLSGENNKDERYHYTKHFLLGKGKILLASDIYKKGITLPEVSILCNVDGGREDSLIIQRRGRALGATENKQNAIIIDLIDEYGEFFSDHSLNRIKVYEQKVGIDNIDVIDTSDADFNKLLFDYLSNFSKL